MKIGVITFWASQNNYGQLLQCWALQKVLRDMGHQPYLIRYDISKDINVCFAKKIWKAFLVYPVIKKIWQILKRKKEKKLAIQLRENDQQRDFDGFREKYIEKSNNVYSNLRQLQKYPPAADCYIAGSDQIWRRPIETDEVTARFLNFGLDDVKRISYAASFGQDVYPAKFIKPLAKALQRLDAISVREKSGVNICAQVGMKAHYVLDPTLLLHATDYALLAEPPANIPGGYLFTYQINITDPKEIHWEEILSYAQKRGWQSLSVTSSGFISGREILAGTTYIYATIPQWLGYIKYSNLVVTTSFHGVAFCVVMHRNFVYVPLEGANAGGNSRVLSLLEDIGLKEKIFKEGQSISHIIEIPIEWEKVEQKLEVLRSDSIMFLCENLNESKGICH